jgi:4-hydroxy-tetrahydrodipicolinate reductase
MIRIGLLGYGGRMGQAIAAELATSKTSKLAIGHVRSVKPEHMKADNAVITSDADKVVALADIVIDFTLPEVTAQHAQLAVAHKKPFVCGTTGLSAKDIDALKLAATKIPLLSAPNTSLSLAAMRQITMLAAKLLGPFDYDVAILDEHHRMKKDSPSGTAKALGEAVVQASGGAKTPNYAAIRAGNIVGNHEVAFIGNGEVIRLQHSVTDRAIFARGAIQAAEWLVGKPVGFYSMDDVLGIG